LGIPATMGCHVILLSPRCLQISRLSVTRSLLTSRYHRLCLLFVINPLLYTAPPSFAVTPVRRIMSIQQPAWCQIKNVASDWLFTPTVTKHWSQPRRLLLFIQSEHHQSNFHIRTVHFDIITVLFIHQLMHLWVVLENIIKNLH